MKKLFIVLALLCTASCLFAYSEKKEIKNVGIPAQVNHIEFWNGGAKVFEENSCAVSIEVATNESLVSFTSKGNQIQFYVYKVRKGNKTVSIVDSEALAIVYW